MRIRRTASVVALALGLFFGPSFAQDTFPSPTKGWWQNLQAEDGTYPSCRFSIEMEAPSGKQTVTMELAITRIEGSSVTFVTKSRLGDTVIPAEEQTIDAETDPMVQGGSSLPEGAIVKKGEAETLDIGGKNYECQIYEVELEGQKLKVWWSSMLPPIFSGGNARIEAAAAGSTSKIQLLEYTGRLIE